jgi:hypothetical protein
MSVMEQQTHRMKKLAAQRGYLAAIMIVGSMPDLELCSFRAAKTFGVPEQSALRPTMRNVAWHLQLVQISPVVRPWCPRMSHLSSAWNRIALQMNAATTGRIAPTTLAICPRMYHFQTPTVLQHTVRATIARIPKQTTTNVAYREKRARRTTK